MDFGVDGVRGIWAFWGAVSSLFFPFSRFSSLFCYSPRGQGEKLQFTAKMGISLRPRLQQPVQNFQNLVARPCQTSNRAMGIPIVYRLVFSDVAGYRAIPL